MILQSNKLHNKRFLSFKVYQYYPQYRNIDYTYRNFSFSGSAAIGTPGFIPYYSGYKNLKLLAGLNNKIGKDEIKSSRNRLDLTLT